MGQMRESSLVSAGLEFVGEHGHAFGLLRAQFFESCCDRAPLSF